MTRSMTCLLALGVLFVGGLAARAETPKLVQRTYPVADLIIPMEASAAPSAFASDATKVSPSTTQDHLMRLIRGTIAPASWAEVGGRGTIDYFPLGMALVINQTPAVQEQIDALLHSLRENLDKEVTVEVRVVSIGARMARHLREAYGIDCTCCRKTDDATESPQVTFLKNDVELFQFMECFQGDRQTNVMQAPKLTMFNGQNATCEIKDYQWFVTGVQKVENAGQVVFVPQNQPIALGWDMGMQPVISGDGKAVHVQVNVTHTSLASATVPLFPVTTFITPLLEGGAQGAPVPFTQFIQQPSVATWKVKQGLSIPVGGTAVLSGWKTNVEKPWDGPPVLEHIPFVNDFFRKFMTQRETQYMLLLVTPRVIEAEKTEAATLPAQAPACVAPGTAYTVINAPPAPPPQRVYAPVPVPCTPVAAPEPAVIPAAFAAPMTVPSESDFLMGVKREVAGLLVQKYRQACRQGRTSDAKTLAEEALRLDPACFSVAPAQR